MLEKKPKSGFKRLLGYTAATIFVAEAAGFAVSYALWYKLNSERGESYFRIKIEICIICFCF